MFVTLINYKQFYLRRTQGRLHFTQNKLNFYDKMRGNAFNILNYPQRDTASLYCLHIVKYIFYFRAHKLFSKIVIIIATKH